MGIRNSDKIEPENNVINIEIENVISTNGFFENDSGYDNMQRKTPKLASVKRDI